MMAGELQIRSVTGGTVYAQVRSATATIWTGSALESYLTANIATYDVVLTEQGTASQLFVGTFPPALAAGTYRVTYWIQAGGSPAETDTFISATQVEWSGSVLLPRAAWALMDADPVGKARTWKARHDRALCREVIEVTTQDTAVYSMDFSVMLSPGTSLLTADSVTDTSGNALATSALTLSQDKTSIHFTITASDLTADTTYAMRATTTTTDGLTFARTGTLRSL